ncbi:hypothetical protein C2G38_2239195 [Gigaspora rosea]|uniref:Protein kinase domain-containing protein n=1 Tax=Gigaspora rosea TaxID=44941 RepID=A0A397W4H3_9GLOM|nr:hypothetical protein C2G38_2239195 [Gigaspora rosea]
MHNCININEAIEINSGGHGVIYKYECKICKNTKVLKRLKDSKQHKKFDNEIQYTIKKSDIFSLGVILWEISSGQLPFKQMSSSEISLLEMQLSDEFRETPTEKTPFQYVELYKKCWNKDPNIRPEMPLIIKT